MNGDPREREDERQIQSGAPAAIVEPRSWLERAKDEVSAWLGDPGALGRRQRDATSGDHTGQGPAPLLNGDERIHDEVSRRLTSEATLDASRIQVAVLARRVTLDGSVFTLADRHRAELLASDVAGVNLVQNRLTVD